MQGKSQRIGEPQGLAFAAAFPDSATKRPNCKD
jgi:hypothetical protein